MHICSRFHCTVQGLVQKFYTHHLKHFIVYISIYYIPLYIVENLCNKQVEDYSYGLLRAKAGLLFQVLQVNILYGSHMSHVLMTLRITVLFLIIFEDRKGLTSFKACSPVKQEASARSPVYCRFFSDLLCFALVFP